MIRAVAILALLGFYGGLCCWCGILLCGAPWRYGFAAFVSCVTTAMTITALVLAWRP